MLNVLKDKRCVFSLQHAPLPAPGGGDGGGKRAGPGPWRYSGASLSAFHFSPKHQETTTPNARPPLRSGSRSAKAENQLVAGVWLSLAAAAAGRGLARRACAVAWSDARPAPAAIHAGPFCQISWAAVQVPALCVVYCVHNTSRARMAGST
jgi:hypothetical protein